MEWFFTWEVASVVVVLLITIALAVIPLNDFKAAKSCFAIAAAYASVSMFFWEANNHLPAIEQIGIGVLSLSFIFLLTIVACRYVDRKERLKQEEQRVFIKELKGAFIREFQGGQTEDHLVNNLENKESRDLELMIPKGEGFAQLEDRSVVVGKPEDEKRVSSGDLKIGEVIKVKFTSSNKGPTPIFDYQSWGAVACVDPSKNPGENLREVMLNGLKAGYEKFRNSGGTLGSGKEVFNFAQSSPLTKEELQGLKNGSLRVHVLLGGAWTSATKKTYYWTNAEWTNWPQVPIAASLWKGA